MKMPRLLFINALFFSQVILTTVKYKHLRPTLIKIYDLGLQQVNYDK